MNAMSNIVTADLAQIIDTSLPWQKLNKARVLVTGANGMIPFYTVLTLCEANKRHSLGLQIFALVRNVARAVEIYGELITDGTVEIIEQDVVAPLPDLAGVTHIIHGASAAQPKQHSINPVGTLTANVLGTHNLLEAALRWGACSFTLMSSAEVYGDTSGRDQLISEESYGAIDILNPRACYSEGKRAAETFAAVYYAQYGIAYTAARFGHIYGPGLSLDDGRVQADFARDVMQGRDITLKSAGLAQRTYTYVADAVAGMFTAILLGEPGAYNISDNAGLTSIRDLAQRFVDSRPEKQLALRFEDAGDQFATSNTQFQGLDSSKLTALGWQPQVSLAEGIGRFISHLEDA